MPAHIANVRFLDLDGDGHLQIVAVDMVAGLVLAADPLVGAGVRQARD
jgi:hypothetical protein